MGNTAGRYSRSCLADDAPPPRPRRLVAAMTRTSVSISAVPPTRKALGLRDAQETGLHVGRHFADFVEEEAAPRARSNAPWRVRIAPVKLPFMAEQLASMRFSGMAPQLTATKGPSLRALCSWMERATVPAGAALPRDQHRGTVGATRRMMPQLRMPEDSQVSAWTQRVDLCTRQE